MLQFNVNSFTKIVTRLIIAQVILSVMITNAQAGVIHKKREIAANATTTIGTLANNDPDIVESSRGPTLKLIAEADSHRANHEESENVTKLRPQSGGSLVLNRVVGDFGEREKGSEELKILKVEENDKMSGSDVGGKNSTLNTESDKQKEEKKVFSHDFEDAKESPESSTISNNVNDGLDNESTVNLEVTVDSLNVNTTMSTTEEILKDIEDIALHQEKNGNLTTNPSSNSMSDLNKFDYGRSMLHSEEMFKLDEGSSPEATTMQTEPKLDKLDEPTQRFDNENSFKAVETTESSFSIHEAATEKPLSPSELIISTAGVRDDVDSSDNASPTTVASSVLSNQVNENVIEESNEIRSKASQSEKRPKFINDNSTNAQQLNLPDAAEVWSLAGLKSVPQKSYITTEETPLTLQNNSLVSSNSEKNLLDWSQIMMNGDLDGKKYDNLIEASTTASTDSLSDIKPSKGLEGTTTEMPLKSNDASSHDNHTEIQINSTVDSTDETEAEEVTKDYSVQRTSSTHLPNRENEILSETTTATTLIATKEIPNIKADSMNREEKEEEEDPKVYLKTTLTSAISDDDSTGNTISLATLSIDKSDNSSMVNTNKTSPVVTKETTLLTENEQKENNTSLYQSTTIEPSKLESKAEERTEESETIVEVQSTSTTTTIATPLATDEPTNTTTTTEMTLTESDLNGAAIKLTPTPPPAAAASNTSINEVTLNSNNNNKSDDDENVSGVGSATEKANNANVYEDDSHNATAAIQQLELSSSTTTSLSTLEAGNVNTTDGLETNFALEGIVKNEKDVVELEKATTTSTSTTTTTTAATTTLPTILPNASTEVRQIGNEVDLEAATTAEPDIISSTIKTHLNEENTQETAPTTTSSTNELLIKPETETTTKIITTTTTTISTNTAATPIEKLPLSTLPSPVTTTGSDVEDNQLAATTTAATLHVEEEVFVETKANTSANSGVSHESESSIETNVVDPVEKTLITTTTTTTTTTATPITEHKDKSVKDSQIETEQKEENNVNNLLPEATTTTMGTFVQNTTTITTTTEPPLISLLDDSSTSTTTTARPTTTTLTPTSIVTKNEEIYSVFPSTTTTTSEKSETSSATTTTARPLDTTSTSEASTPFHTSTTTMLPPVVIHAAIGGAAATAATPSHISPPDMTSGNIHPNSADTGGTDVNVIIAISVSVIGVVALILLVAFLYLMRKRQKQMSYGQRCRPVSLDAYSLENVSVMGSVRRKSALRASKRSYGNVAFDDPSLRHNNLSASELAKFAERRSSIFEEFRDVPQIIARADEVPQGCEDKNRYANVIPLPETRVILQQQNDDEKTEYINANYVRGPKDAPNYYVACQAPLETTVIDFWRMIWEQQSRVIIQATDLMENGIEKCAEYLPPSVTLDNHTTYGDYQVTLKNREVKDKYAITTIMLKNIVEDASRELTHYWYKWPETGVPAEEAPIIAMLLEARSSLKSYAIEQANELKEKSSTITLKSVSDRSGDAAATAGDGKASPTSSMEKKEVSSVSGSSNGEINGNVSTDKLKAAARNQGPLTIHCSPGTGRTGTIIACDMAIRSLETPKRSVDIPQIVYYVRRGRASAVQTKEQYEFIYKVTNMYGTKITNLSNDN